MSTKHTLRELIDMGIVHDGDEVYFEFKGTTFSATLARGGILHNCRYDGTLVFTDRPGFVSLTDWTDSCIQELAQEFVTRFSSWRRVKHRVTGNPLCTLRDVLWTRKRPEMSYDAETVPMDDFVRERRRVLHLEQELERHLAAKDGEPDEDSPFGSSKLRM
jgi:hypothetical protein